MKTPWGRMWKLAEGKKFWIKILFVRGRTSLQSHAEREEWHLGFYRVKKGEKHRLQRGLFLELALGNPFEDDIVRHEDDYGRKQ